MKAIFGYAVLIVLTLALGIGGWKLERWLNWKLDYGRKVDRRIEQLEKRIEALERRTANAPAEARCKASPPAGCSQGVPDGNG